MYLSFFGLSEKPFAITPDPRYLYLSERHAEALAHLLYGINESGGFIQLTGEVGTGKTTVVRTLLSRVPHHADVAVILNPRVTPVEFLLTICEELGVSIAEADRDSVKQMVDALNRRLLSAHAEGRRIIVLVDEAQNLSIEVLEQVRLLTNLETPTQKLLQIILIGQPELRELLDRTDLRQLAQRITGRYHLKPLSREETKGYVRHRLARCRRGRRDFHAPARCANCTAVSSGIPRVINVACDRALLGAYTQDVRKITPALVRRAAGEVYGRHFCTTLVGLARRIDRTLGALGCPHGRLAAAVSAEFAAQQGQPGGHQHRLPVAAPHLGPGGRCATRAGDAAPNLRRPSWCRSMPCSRAAKPIPPTQPRSADCCRCGEQPWPTIRTPVDRPQSPGSPVWSSVVPGPRCGRSIVRPS